MSKPFYRPHISYGPYPFHMMQNDYPQPGAFMPYPFMGREYPPEVVDEDTELEYWRGMYPERVKKVQQCVDEACDKMDYDGSMMYDEYPDKIALYRLSKSIYQMLMNDPEFMQQLQQEMEETPMENEEELYESSQYRGPEGPMGPGPVRPPRPQRPPQPPQNNWLKNLIDVLLFQEMHRRRCNRRDCRRRWY